MTKLWPDESLNLKTELKLKFFLKEVIDTQEKIIKDLMKSVREQHEQLNSQNNKIKSLEEKVGKKNPKQTIKQCKTSKLSDTDYFSWVTEAYFISPCFFTDQLWLCSRHYWETCRFKRRSSKPSQISGEQLNQHEHSHKWWGENRRLVTTQWKFFNAAS